MVISPDGAVHVSPFQGSMKMNPRYPGFTPWATFHRPVGAKIISRLPICCRPSRLLAECLAVRSDHLVMLLPPRHSTIKLPNQRVPVASFVFTRRDEITAQIDESADAPITVPSPVIFQEYWIEPVAPFAVPQ